MKEIETNEEFKVHKGNYKETKNTDKYEKLGIILI